MIRLRDNDELGPHQTLGLLSFTLSPNYNRPNGWPLPWDILASYAKVSYRFLAQKIKQSIQVLAE